MAAPGAPRAVDDCVNMRDLTLGINDWYNVTPSVRRAIEGFALILQSQQAHLARVDHALVTGEYHPLSVAPVGLSDAASPPPPGMFATTGLYHHHHHPSSASVPPGSPLHHDPAALTATSHSVSEMAHLSVRVDDLTRELVVTKAKLRALEAASSGEVAETTFARACDLATARAEAAAREAAASAKTCREIDASAERAEAAAAEAVKARDAFASSLATKAEGSESRVRVAAAQAEVRCRAAGDELRNALRELGIDEIPKGTGGSSLFGMNGGNGGALNGVFGGAKTASGARADAAAFASVRAEVAELRRVVLGDDEDDENARGVGPGSPFGTPGHASRSSPRGGGGSVAGTPEARAGPGGLLARVADVAAKVDGARYNTPHAAGYADGASPNGSNETRALAEGLRRLHRAVGSELKARPTTETVREMVAAEMTGARRSADDDPDSDASPLARRVGALEDGARAMERRQRRVERVLGDVKSWASAAEKRLEVERVRELRSETRSDDESDDESDDASDESGGREADARRKGGATKMDALAGASVSSGLGGAGGTRF